MSGRIQLAKTFSLNLLSGASKVSVSSSSTFSEVKVQLGEGTQQSQRRLVSAFLWLDRKTQGRTRVEDEAGFQVCRGRFPPSKFLDFFHPVIFAVPLDSTFPPSPPVPL